MTQTPIRPTDDDARTLARGLIAGARFAALGVLTAEGTPFVTRIALGTDAGRPLTLISTLAFHTQALTANPACSLLVGEPGPKGDPLTHPRLTIEAHAAPLEKSATLRDAWLAQHPKAKLYIDFADFGFVGFAPTGALLNAGFGKAYRLTPADLTP